MRSFNRAAASFLALLLLVVSGALAGFDLVASNNIAIYWGQNSASRPGSQVRLASYCANSPVNIIPLAFLHVIKNPTAINFSNAGDNCTTFPNSQLLKCPEIEADIIACQQTYNKTILLSIGGATYTESGFTSPDEATTFATLMWQMFGPPSSSTPASVNRPFGQASVDGFDLDIEAVSKNMVPFTVQLRKLMDLDTGTSRRKYYLSAAPQCPFPDAAMGEVLASSDTRFDFVSVQFYNNYCGVQSYVPGNSEQFNFNFGTWDTWARNKTGVKVLLGVPGSASATGSGYISGDSLKEVVRYVKGFASFGGIMVWDMSQVYGNPGFLDSIASALSVPPLPPSTTTTTRITSTSTTSPIPTGTRIATIVTTFTTFTTTTTTITSASPTDTGVVPQWGQCGGVDYTGSTKCVSPWVCREISKWWSHCN
ncbi:endochitinase 33 [Podospora fimiseda]|uniref:chitinase n=1 Tax=Podospora fimiseda TaxID=252190 RepID=A0AAN7BS91_9PEZI|nr:endochitinase 33 [Podospora fimiseda]